MSNHLPRVLIVEDTPINAFLYRAQIKRREPSFEVAVASSLQSAREEVEHFHPDVVVVDMHLPDSTPIETAASFRSFSVPVLAMSVDTNLEAMALEGGAADFMPKMVGQNATPLMDRLLKLLA